MAGTIMGMTTMLYKVSVGFDTQDATTDELVFNFVELPEDARNSLHPKFFPHLMKLVDENPEFIHSASIRSALDSNGRPLSRVFKNFHVVLFSNKSTNQKRGFLIAFGEDKEKGFIRAAWPASFRDAIIKNPRELVDAITDLSVHQHSSENVNILSQA